MELKINIFDCPSYPLVSHKELSKLLIFFFSMFICYRWISKKYSHLEYPMNPLESQFCVLQNMRDYHWGPSLWSFYPDAISFLPSSLEAKCRLIQHSEINLASRWASDFHDVNVVGGVSWTGSVCFGKEGKFAMNQCQQRVVLGLVLTA